MDDNESKRLARAIADVIHEYLTVKKNEGENKPITRALRNVSDKWFYTENEE